MKDVLGKKRPLTSDQAILLIERLHSLFLGSYSVKKGWLFESEIQDVSSGYTNDIEKIRNDEPVSIVKYAGLGAVIE